MLGISVTDWSVIVFYLLGITVIGSLAAKKVTSSASLFMGERKFGKAMMVFFGFGSGTHSDQAVSVAAKTYAVGASGIWYQWALGFCDTLLLDNYARFSTHASHYYGGLL